jgi:GT2 family glycosyltransferase
VSGARRPLVSIVVVTWNGLHLLPACLASLHAQTYPNLEIVVVDNGSTDGSAAWLEQVASTRVHVIQSPVNLGFAGGNNLGIQAGKGQYVALLNNDATAEPGWVEALVAAAEADPGVGMCASKIYLQDGDGVLDSAGGLLLSRDGIGRGRGRLERDGPEFARSGEALLPSGCAALYRRAMLDEIGLFDADFFAYCEDSDLGLRGRLAGWRCRYVAEAVVFHRYSGTARAYSPFKAFQVERNRLWVVIKCFPLPLALASLPCSLVRYLAQAYGALSRRGAAGRLASDVPAWWLLRLVVRAWWAALRRLPEMWRRRRHIQSSRRVSAREVRGWLERFHLGIRELALKE